MRTITRLTSACFAKQGEAFAQVNLPHTWNALDGQDGGGDFWRGLGTYIIDLPDPTKGKKQYLEIRGANHVATVYCNGRELGTHKGGFGIFRFDLTGALKPAGNQVTVTVSNAVSDIYPQNADFTFFGGLYRDVNFIEVDEAHFDLLKSGSEAVFVTPRISGLTRIDAFPVNAEGCTVVATLCDAEGNVVLAEQAPAVAQTVFKMKVAQPHLWQGVEDPYLYTAKLELVKGEKVVDCVTVEYGYRGFHVDPENGFFLNGKSMPLRGVTRHQDREDMGWALTKKEHEEDVALICEVGANTIRLAHYEHEQYFYTLCDRAGLVLWAEIPFISQYIPSKEAHDNTLSQMTELIAQSYNHPAICFWGISNEITIAGESEGLYQNLCELNALVKKLDPSRLTTMAQVSMVPKNSEHNYITDVVSYNHYFGWYVGDVDDNGPWLDEFHKLNPDRPLGISEYGAECILSWHSAQPEDHDYTEEYQAFYHHEMLKVITARPYLWATHMWNMFDFAADNRDEGGVKGRNNKGLMTMDRKTKKDAYYICQAYWAKKPVLHVCGERFVDRAPGERDVTVYTNCDEVTLYVNGSAVETKKAVDHAVVFANVALLEGANTVTAKSGEVEGNTITLKAVAEHNYAYDLPEGNQAANWFDDPAAVAARKKLECPAGYYSIKDKVLDLMQNPQTSSVLMEAFKAAASGGPMAAMANPAMLADPNNPMGEMLRGMRLNSLLKMAGKAVTMEMKVALNEALTKVKKD